MTGDLNRSLGDNAAFRLNVMAHEADVAGRNIIGGDRWGVAPTVSFGLNGPTKAILSYYHMQSSEIPDTGIPFNNPFTSGANLAKQWQRHSNQCRPRNLVWPGEPRLPRHQVATSARSTCATISATIWCCAT